MNHEPDGKAKNKLLRAAANLAMVAVSLLFGLAFCEGSARLFLDPADYLSKELVDDQILGAVLIPNTQGYDEWGFRNRSVPQHAEIVALGDSHTFGNTAKRDDSWPSVLGQLTGSMVYNFGMGGYGPNQYYHLLTTQALSLRPKIIVCGLYFGDDFENAFRMTYGLDHWSFLRQKTFGTINADIWEDPDDPVAGRNWERRTRVWLSQHSLVYQILFHGPLAARFLGEAQIANASRLNKLAVTLIVPEKNIAEAFVPKSPLRGLDQESESVREGMRITLKLLEDMHKLAQKNEARFIVLIIPTKEMVFAEYLEADRSLTLYDIVRKLLANERVARQQVFAFLDQANIPYVDALPALRAGIGQQLYARSAGDMHPGKIGYHKIAEVVAKYLEGVKAAE